MNPQRRWMLTLAVLVALIALAGTAWADINRTYVYNGADQLIEVKESGVTVAEHAYDGDGERVRKTAGGQEVIYVRGPSGEVLAEYDGSGDLIAEYVYLNGRKIARIAAGGATTYYHNDHLGTPRAITNSSGQVTWAGDNLPFWEEQSSSGARADTYTFTGHEHDAGIDLIYAHARYYDPEVGRFITTDPVGGDPANPQSWNRYVYVSNKPLSLVDPDGKDVEVANRPVQDFPLSNHAYIVVTPTGANAERYKNRINKEGHIVLSGGPGLGFHPKTGRARTSLVKWDVDLRSAATQLIEVQPSDQTTDQFESNVIEAFDSYVDGSLPYNNVDVGGKNSNALASGVLSAAGAGETLPSSGDLRGWNPGWSDPVKLPDATANDVN